MAQREGVFLKVTGQVSSPDFHLCASSVSTPTVSEGRRFRSAVLGVEGKRVGGSSLP